MKAEQAHSRLTLAARREALLAECAAQRVQALDQAMALARPLGPQGLGRLFGRPGKVVLALAGVALGLAAARPARALSLLTAGVALWKLARSALAALRH